VHIIAGVVVAVFATLLLFFVLSLLGNIGVVELVIIVVLGLAAGIAVSIVQARKQRKTG
jgi:hypothetical protein